MTGQTEPDGDQDQALAPFLALLDADMTARPTEATQPLTPALKARLEALTMAAGHVDPDAAVEGDVAL